MFCCKIFTALYPALRDRDTMPSALKNRERASSSDAHHSDPLPANPSGKRLCEIFGRYLYCSIYADAPEDAKAKVKWYTQHRYKLKPRVLYRDWLDAEKLIGVRPGHETAYALLDIDINSPYHPKQDASAIARIEAALETIGITRTLRIRSSWSEGLHLYIPLPELVKTFDLAVALKNCLEPQGFQLKQGHLECFPNVKAYGNIIKTEYLAHRLPMQPGSGSCLLDESFSPAGNQLEEFLSLWDIAAKGQDILTLRQALPLARKNRYKKVRNRLSKVDSWKRDLETVIAEGWTGPGQTNQLLKEFGCYGHVFLGYCDEELVDFIHQQAISSPGYQQWCRHQREIKMRSRVWATAVEKYYWPMGTYKEAQKASQETINTIVPFNNLRAQNARSSITAAVEHLESAEALPEKATARALAIREAQADLGTSSSSLETLYKAENKALWHPDFYSDHSESEPDRLPVIDETTSLSEAEPSTQGRALERLEPSETKRLRTEEKIMKCESTTSDVLPSSKTKFYSGKGGVGGEKSFPQDELEAKTLHRKVNRAEKKTVTVDGFIPIPPAQAATQTVTQTARTKNIKAPVPKLRPKPRRKTVPNTSFREDGIPKALSETIVAIQGVVRKLGWSIGQVNSFIAQEFQGRRRAQLSDEELIKLLYRLQVQCLESAKANLDKAQKMEAFSSAPAG